MLDRNFIQTYPYFLENHLPFTHSHTVSFEPTVVSVNILQIFASPTLTELQDFL
jgi:hypothetical protein